MAIHRRWYIFPSGMQGFLRMSFFGAPRGTYPKRWSEYSLDFQIVYIWQISLFALILLTTTGLLKIVPEELLEAALAVWFLILLGTSIYNRRRKDWRWRGLSRSDWIKSIFGTILMIVFLYVFSQGLLPLKSITLPMFLFALSIVVFNILASLRVVQYSEVDFLKSCGDALASPDFETGNPTEPKWKRVVRQAYSVMFILVWLDAMAFFYVHQKYTHEGSLKPTATQTESFNEHGTLIYLTHDKMHINNILLSLMAIGIPSMILGGFFLHFVAGVPMFSNMPESRGLFGRDSNL